MIQCSTMRLLRSSVALSAIALTTAFGVACGSSGGSNDGSEVTLPQPDSSTGSNGNDSGTYQQQTGSNDGGSNFMVTTMTSDAGDGATEPLTGPLVISPTNQIVTVTYGQQTPGVTYTAYIEQSADAGTEVPASFSIDRGEIGSIVAATGAMTPAGFIGGTAHVTATYGSQTVSTPVTVVIQLVQNGAAGGPAVDGGSDSGASGDAGLDGASGDAGDASSEAGAAASAEGGTNAGGNGGVGGNGVGGPVDAGTLATLGGTPTTDTTLSWLYPYNNTVWPQGLLAPLLQWSTQTSYDGVYVHITETGLDYQGYFAATATPFVNTPIPQTAWDAIGYSNMGDPVTVSLTFSSGGVAYGPITQTWTFAQTALSGTVYYNSYGTNLAHNYCCTLEDAGFGGATLAIKHGATDPVLVAGNDSECRVCHSVSADGSRLVTQQSNNPTSSTYDLLNGYLETVMSPDDSRFAWGGLYPDGTFLISDSAPSSLQGAGWLADAGNDASPPTVAPETLFSLPDGGSIPSSGIPEGGRMASPVFSPDGNHVVFNFYGGTFPVGLGRDGGPVAPPDAGGTTDGGGATDAAITTIVGGDAGDGGTIYVTGDWVSLAMMDFDVTTSTFSNFQVLFTPPAGTSVWPSFMPTNGAVVFELEVENNGRDWGGTRSHCDSNQCANESDAGSRGELWWVDVASKTAAPLDALNGKLAGESYLPADQATGHWDDTTLNFEPTVNPVPGGGFAWVVFTSRRLYGNVATLPPYYSDPRYVNLTTSPTPKKLWVAAIDLTGTPGTDVSHPAFYLPGQELLAGNSRGYWVVDPCEPNGTSCATGDQCCGGYCEDVDGGFVCSAQPPACSSLSDKCTTASDCCGYTSGTQCINSRCAEPAPIVPPPVPVPMAQ
jgi:hypothetical protein